MFFQLLMSGLAIGCVYSLVALGFVLVASSANVMNFAHGEWVMIGAYLGVTFSVTLKLNLALSLLITALCMVVVGWVFTRLVFYPLRHRHLLTTTMATLGISIALQNAAMHIWGPYPLMMPLFFGDKPVSIGGAKILPQSIFIVVFTLVLIVGLGLAQTHTKMGLKVQAAAQDSEAAQIMGIKVNRVKLLIYCLAAVMAGTAGFLVAPIIVVTPTMGFMAMLKGLAATIVGGWGSLKGAVAGGLLIGVAETLVAGYISTSYKDVLSFTLLVLVVLFRPSGIVREKVGQKV